MGVDPLTTRLTRNGESRGRDPWISGSGGRPLNHSASKEAEQENAGGEIPGSPALGVGALTTGPTRRLNGAK